MAGHSSVPSPDLGPNKPTSIPEGPLRRQHPGIICNATCGMLLCCVFNTHPQPLVDIYYKNTCQQPIVDILIFTTAPINIMPTSSLLLILTFLQQQCQQLVLIVWFVPQKGMQLLVLFQVHTIYFASFSSILMLVFHTGTYQYVLYYPPSRTSFSRQQAVGNIVLKYWYDTTNTRFPFGMWLTSNPEGVASLKD